jgi:hypothetical protein
MKAALKDQTKQKTFNNIQDLIGNYHALFSDLLHRMKKIGIDIAGMPLSHLLYRTSTMSEYHWVFGQV